MKGGTVEKDKNPKEKKTMVKPFCTLRLISPWFQLRYFVGRKKNNAGGGLKPVFWREILVMYQAPSIFSHGKKQTKKI